jgi:hypothetical protein
MICESYAGNMNCGAYIKKVLGNGISAASNISVNKISVKQIGPTNFSKQE